jgi:chromate reductase, NAD(P)H dehydrogenase (quinone)
MHILAISGSLRAASSNTFLLQAAARLAPAGVEIVLYAGLGNIPPFNPDLDGAAAAPAVTDLRTQLQQAAAVLISSPEYAHGISGVLKNALDWLVGSGELVDKPVGLINASPRATHAHAQLSEILTVMSARLIATASIAVPLLGKGYDAAGIAADPEIAEPLRAALRALAAA